jgi:DNA-binding transcriptional MerR regulator
MDDLGQLLTIGRFARVAGLTPKALRIYERMGILRPASIDPDTGYRYYSLTQLETAETVRLLRELEVPLTQVRVLITGEDPAAIRDVLARHRVILEERLSHLSRLVDRLEGTLGSDREPLSHDVVVEEEPARLVVSLRRQIAGDQGDAPLNAAEWACEAELAASLAARGLAPAGRPITLHHNVLQWYEHYDVEVCLPVDAGAAGQLGGEAWELPGGPCATTVFRGPWEELSPAYAALMSWIARRRLAVVGPARWFYLVDERDTVDPREYVTRFSWPVRERPLDPGRPSIRPAS